jgi:hypothetical protein
MWRLGKEPMMIAMTPRSSLSSKVLLVADARAASGTTGSVPVRRYRIARLPVTPRVSVASRFEQLKRPLP